MADDGVTAVLDPRLSRSRAPLDPGRISAGLAAPTPWRISCVAETGSTNDDLVSAAASGAAAGTVLIAELQTSGRGRRQRSWVTPAGAGLTMSVLLDLSHTPALRLGWTGIVGALALSDALRRCAAVDAVLKWPNDVLVDGAKIAGVLSTSCGDGRVVLGMGLNVSLTSDELPRRDAGSLWLAGAGSLDRTLIAAATLDALDDRITRWREADWDPSSAGLLADYRSRCATIGRPVRAEMPDGAALLGTAVTVDANGSLVVETADGRRTLAAADVVHLRPEDPR